MIYVFKSENGNYDNLAIRAETVEEAMKIVVTEWHPHYFSFDFSVTLVNNTQGE